MSHLHPKAVSLPGEDTGICWGEKGRVLFSQTLCGLCWVRPPSWMEPHGLCLCWGPWLPVLWWDPEAFALDFLVESATWKKKQLWAKWSALPPRWLMPLCLASVVKAYCTSVKNNCMDQSKHLGTKKTITPCLHTHIQGPKLGALVHQKLKQVHEDFVAPYLIPYLFPSVPDSCTRS